MTTTIQRVAGGLSIGVWLVLGAPEIRAVPTPLRVQGAEVALNVPEGFEEAPPASNQPADVLRFFMRKDVAQGEPDTWLTIQSLPGDAATTNLWPKRTATSEEVLRRYSESWNDLDISVLSKRVTENQTNVYERTALLPLQPNAVEVKLESRAMQDKEMAELMRKVLASVEKRRNLDGTLAATGGMPIWGKALLYLALAGLIIVVAFARR